jgi:NAD(P)-dependent dehydrogenase (short-subunit alcohol dehydrogenase family)
MPFVGLPPDGADASIRRDVLAVTRLTRAALPGMILRSSGAMINVSSALAFSASAPARHLPYRADGPSQHRALRLSLRCLVAGTTIERATNHAFFA